MGFFDDDNNVDFFSAAGKKGAGVAGGTSKPKAASPLTKPKPKPARPLDDDDDDFFAEFNVDLDMDVKAAPAAAVPPPAPAAAAAAAPTTAGEQPQEMDDDAALMDDDAGIGLQNAEGDGEGAAGGSPPDEGFDAGQSYADQQQEGGQLGDLVPMDNQQSLENFQQDVAQYQYQGHDQEQEQVRLQPVIGLGTEQPLQERVEATAGVVPALGNEEVAAVHQQAVSGGDGGDVEGGTAGWEQDAGTGLHSDPQQEVVPDNDLQGAGQVDVHQEENAGYHMEVQMAGGVSNCDMASLDNGGESRAPMEGTHGSVAEMGGPGVEDAQPMACQDDGGALPAAAAVVTVDQDAPIATADAITAPTDLGRNAAHEIPPDVSHEAVQQVDGNSMATSPPPPLLQPNTEAPAHRALLLAAIPQPPQPIPSSNHQPTSTPAALAMEAPQPSGAAIPQRLPLELPGAHGVERGVLLHTPTPQPPQPQPTSAAVIMPAAVAVTVSDAVRVTVLTTATAVATNLTAGTVAPAVPLGSAGPVSDAPSVTGLHRSSSMALGVQQQPAAAQSTVPPPAPPKLQSQSQQQQQQQTPTQLLAPPQPPQPTRQQQQQPLQRPPAPTTQTAPHQKVEPQRQLLTPALQQPQHQTQTHPPPPLQLPPAPHPPPTHSKQEPQLSPPPPQQPLPAPPPGPQPPPRRPQAAPSPTALQSRAPTGQPTAISAVPPPPTNTSMTSALGQAPKDSNGVPLGPGALAAAAAATSTGHVAAAPMAGGPLSAAAPTRALQPRVPPPPTGHHQQRRPTTLGGGGGGSGGLPGTSGTMATNPHAALSRNPAAPPPATSGSGPLATAAATAAAAAASQSHHPPQRLLQRQHQQQPHLSSVSGASGLLASRLGAASASQPQPPSIGSGVSSSIQCTTSTGVGGALGSAAAIAAAAAVATPASISASAPAAALLQRSQSLGQSQAGSESVSSGSLLEAAVRRQSLPGSGQTAHTRSRQAGGGSAPGGISASAASAIPVSGGADGGRTGPSAMQVPAPVVSPPLVDAAGGGGGGGAIAAAQVAVGMLRPPQAVGGSSGSVSGSGNPETPLPTLPPSSGRTTLSTVPAPLAEAGVSSAIMSTPTAAAVMTTPGPTMELLGNGTAAVSPVPPTAAAAFGSPTAVTPTATLAAVVTPVPPAFALGSHARALGANAGGAALASPFAASSARDGTLPPAHQQQQPLLAQRPPPPGHVAAAASDAVANTRMGAQAATRSASGPGLTATRPATTTGTMDAAATGHSARIADSTPPAIMPTPAAAPAALFAGPAATPLGMTGPSPSATGGTASGGPGRIGGTLELSPSGGSGDAVVSMAAVLSDPIKALEMMILEAQALRDQIMDRRVQSSILSNRLVRLDNPMLRDRIAALKAEAEAALQSNARIHEELLGGSAGSLASVATDVDVGCGAIGEDNRDVV